MSALGIGKDRFRVAEFAVSDESPGVRTYAIRLQERAIRDVTAAFVRLAELGTVRAANAWHDGLKTAIGGLATNPHRFPRAPERFQGDVRHMLYRRSSSSITYRVLFMISEAGPDSVDPPTVTILHVRHASMRPLTRTQARQIESPE
jgi:plasmid stabilization system protein ParE